MTDSVDSQYFQKLLNAFEKICLIKIKIQLKSRLQSDGKDEGGFSYNQ